MELGHSDQEASPSTGKNTGVVLVPCRTWKCVPTGPLLAFVTTNESTVSVTKIISMIGISWTHTLPFGFLPLFDSYGHIIKSI